MPSARPTSVPEFDVAELASSSLTQEESPFPLDLAVPVLVGSAMRGFDLRSAFLLLHVDGRSSIAEISSSAGLPVREVLRCFTLLVAAGAVTFNGELAQAVPRSGTFPKELFDADLERRSGT